MGINSMKSNKYMLRNTPATSNNKEVLTHISNSQISRELHITYFIKNKLLNIGPLKVRGEVFQVLSSGL